ncbi:nicotinate-nucleotide--dimethylbenzimidazole phosphoribosyltransferase [Streptomyces arenae]|uniref:nicotinate-nucleotide--dimethylbenzimidazole phosphoribosyltransferase n=1 Tax=Streptomyces arenae TaxID=29301 RepID=UPI0026584121|nr:nicotinate-nucleotide--dimethylbenzimidazole phosphoribosyltransferase [Streptomyces arenae]MCG7207855.1 nicotinate-nucleotide--dimethylbenzimidazole phosphoribosyltransferase [Streptomyces arenae]
MTDTGQVPGEGLPESAGMVEQPGVPAHGAYTYLSESPAEDEDLLLPGAQGAWGNEVPPPAPEPVVEAVHEPGPHETGGRDSGQVDLTAVRLPNSVPASPILSVPHDPATAPAPRRPLHLGPPIPDASASPVRSLADRGPAGAPVRQPGVPSAGPEYLDAQPLREAAPQSAAPWGAPGTVSPAVPQAVPVAQVAAQVAAAETVVPVPEPVAAQAVAQTPDVSGAAPLAMAGVDGYGPQGVAQPVAQASEGAQGPVTGGQPQPVPVAEAPQPPHVLPGQGAVPMQAAAPTGAGPVDVQGAGGAPAETVVVPAPATEGGAPETAAVEGAAPQPAAPEAAAPEAVGPEAPGSEAAGPEVVVQAVVAADADAVAPAAVAPAVVAPEGVAPQAVAEAVGPEVAPPGQQPVPVVAEPVATEPNVPDPQAVEQVPAGQVVPETVVPEQPVAEQAVAEPVVAEPGVAEEAVVPEAAAEAVTPEAVTPEAVAPEAVAPEAVAPEAVVPEALVPAAVAVEAVVPESVPVSEAVVPESVPVPEAVAAEPGQPQVVDPAGPAPVAEPTAVTEPPQALAAVAPEAGQPAPDAVPAEDAAAPAAVPQAETVTPEGVDVPRPLAGPDAPATRPVPPVEVPLAGPQIQGTAPTEPAVAQQPPAADRTAEAAEPEQPALGEFVAVDGQVPTTPHLAPTPPHPLVLPAQDQGEPVTGQAATVPAPREAEPGPVAEAHPDVVQQAADLETRVAEQEESTAPVAEARQSTGPAAPAYDDAEREAVLKVMRERRDIRNGFRSDPIPHEVLLRVLEAAHTAPSVGHSQPWDFVVIRSADTRRSMHELAMRQRDAYAKSLPKGRAKQFKELKIEAILDTPVNIVVTADPTRGGRHTLGRHTQPQMAPYSAALAVENLWLAARAEGLGVGWVSFFDEREMVRALGLPEHLEVIAYLCVGYVDEFPDEPELMQAGWSKRRPLSWVVHEETYGRRALPGEDPHDLLAETVASVRPLDAKALGEAWERQKRMTKPAGALGMLEIISAQLSGLSRQCPPPIPEPAAVAIFAGDHGVHAQGVTPWPQEVTAQMVANFLGGGAVCNAFAGQVGAEVCVVDVGVASELPATPGLLPRKVRAGTSDMTTGPAMTREEAKQAIEVGIETARDLVAAGNKALLTGEMGIANTTASAALISVFTGADPAEVTGRGTGINDETLARKTEVVRRALELHQPDPADPIGVLAAVGGFEHAAMVGLLLGGASLRTPVILDGVSAGAAALVARAIAPEVLAACIAGHRSAEPGHVAALNKLGLRPLVDLDLRLGEGTGALLALPLVQSTARAMHEVATFDSAGVTEK